MVLFATSRTQPLAVSQTGFTLLGVIIAIAVFNIFLGVAVTSWTFVNQRDRETELIWRGEQYSRALQCFIEKRGVPPTELEELLEEHCIRRLYPDPMSPSGEWRTLRAADLGEEFAGLVAGLTGGSDPVGMEPEAGGNLGVGGEPRVGEDLEGRRSGLGRSSLLDRLRNSRSKTGAQQRGGGTGSQLGSGQGAGRTGSQLGSGQGAGRTGFQLGSGQGAGRTGSQLGSSLRRAGAPSGSGSQIEGEGGQAGRQSLAERAQGRLKSKLAKRNLTGRSGRDAGNEADVLSGVLGVATSSSGEAIRTYKEKSRYEEWYFTLGGTNSQSEALGPLGPQMPGQEALPPTDSGATGIRGGTEERRSKVRRKSLRRGG